MINAKETVIVEKVESHSVKWTNGFELAFDDKYFPELRDALPGDIYELIYEWHHIASPVRSARKVVE